jgi:vacuolar-type H+-ATPase subunit I/STV1
MKRAARVLGWIALFLAGGLLLLGVSTWPPEGLYFAAPYFFLAPGVALALVGGVLVWFGGRPCGEV